MANTAIVITGARPGIMVRGRARSAQAGY